jgi:hypothetical protein
MPGTSPNGKWAKYISPGCIYRLPVFERVDVLPRVEQFVSPFFGNSMCPSRAGIVVFRQ